MKKCSLIFWEISDFTTTRERIEELGFSHLVPRNDHRSAMLKALRKITKGNDRMYRKFNDRPGTVSFGLFLENTSTEEITLDREMIIHLDKSTGKGAMKGGTPKQREELMTHFEVAKGTLDSGQFRSLILRIVKRDCFGVAMRKSGGIYFVDKDLEKNLGQLTELFQNFPDTTHLHTVPIYDDKGTQEALEHAVSEDISTDIISIVKVVQEKLKKGSLTRRGLEGKIKEADQIFDKISVHQKNLRSKLKKVTKQLEMSKNYFTNALDGASTTVMDPKEFLEELVSL